MTQQTGTAQTEPLVSDLVDHLVQFDGPPEEFLMNLLAVQCHVGSAEGGAILRASTSNESEPEVIAIYPPPQTEHQTVPAWVVQAVQVMPQAMTKAKTVTIPVQMPDQLYGQEPQAYLLLISLRGNQSMHGAAAFFIHNQDVKFVEQCRLRLELTVSLLNLYEMRLALQARRSDLTRMRCALQVLAALNELDRFKASAMAFCNELATVFKAERVCIGFVKGRYVRVEGMSHTEKIVRKMELVQAVESTMEECLDQDVEVTHPQPDNSSFVSRAAEALATRHGPTTVCSLPLRRARKPQAVLTIERAVDQPFALDDIETMRLVADLCTARLLELYDHDKWVGAKVAGALRQGLATLLGPQHTWVKFIVVGAFAAILFLTLYRADWRVEAPFEIQTINHQVIAAPFTGRVQTVNVEKGDQVIAGEDVLVTLDTLELRAELAGAEAQRLTSIKGAALYKREGDTARSQIAIYEAQQAEAKIKLLKAQINKASIRSNINGVVIEGDLKGFEGATIDRGVVLFRVAQVQTLRAELLVAEKDIADVRQAFVNSHIQREIHDIANNDTDLRDGELASVARPGTYLPFVVERISPVAEVVEQRNVFQVRVRFQLHQLDQMPAWLSPGLEGVAKVHIGKANYAWLWTRDLVDWVRMKLWL